MKKNNINNGELLISMDAYVEKNIDDEINYLFKTDKFKVKFSPYDGKINLLLFENSEIRTSKIFLYSSTLEIENSFADFFQLIDSKQI